MGSELPSQIDREFALADRQHKFMVAQGQISIIVGIINIVQTVVVGATYRKNLSAIVKTLEADHVMRHQDVDKLIEVLDLFGSKMSETIRDEYYLAILDLLKSSGRIALPLPPS